jgi:hypothetical protein
MIVNAVPDGDPPYALVEGIRSDRALSVLIRAVMHWYAFGRYNHVIVDLTGFDDWSPLATDSLVTAVGAAADAGHWLAFFPLGTCWLRGVGAGGFHVYPDRAHAQRAMKENQRAAAAKACKRRYRRSQA